LKKQSAASSKPPEPVTFFLDRSLGSLKVAKALRVAQQSVVIHDDVFPQDAQDTTWLPEVGRRGWVVLTKDRHIRTRRNEVAELMAAGLAVFVVTKADMSGDEMALAFVAALPAMLRMVARKPRPLLPGSAQAGSSRCSRCRQERTGRN
jgi:hypothetical protein